MHIRWRGLELPSLVTCDPITLTRTYGKFVAEPFERGFGVTIGNSLRRILLSSLEGSAVTQIKIHGAQHEFTTLPGVVEDMTDIVLNVKSLVVKNYSDPTKVMRIEKNTRGVVTGADVQTDDTVEVINKDHVIATLTDDVPFVDGNGGGERPRLRAGHRAQPQRAGDRHHSDRRRLQPRGPRALRDRRNPRRPEDQLRQADAGNLDQRLDRSGDGAGRVGQDSPQAPQSVRAVQRIGLAGRARRSLRQRRSAWMRAIEPKLNMSLADLKLSVRATNCLESENIHTVRDLVQRTEDQLLEVRNFGETTLQRSPGKTGRAGLAAGHARAGEYRRFKLI